MSKKVNTTKALLHRLYIKERKSVRKISQELNCGEATILAHLNRYKIPTRSRSEALKGISLSEETKRKISENAKGRKLSQETKDKISKIHKGRKNYWFSGRRKNEGGYIQLWNGKKYILEHRNVIENKIGRSLKRNEVVHHKNGIKDDNRIENLVLIKRTKHKNLHTAKVACPFCQEKFWIRNAQK